MHACHVEVNSSHSINGMYSYHHSPVIEVVALNKYQILEKIIFCLFNVMLHSESYVLFLNNSASLLIMLHSSNDKSCNLIKIFLQGTKLSFS